MDGQEPSPFGNEFWERVKPRSQYSFGNPQDKVANRSDPQNKRNDDAAGDHPHAEGIK